MWLAVFDLERLIVLTDFGVPLLQLHCLMSLFLLDKRAYMQHDRQVIIHVCSGNKL